MDNLQRIAYENIPRGHAVVREGMPRPDDLIWSWPTQEWIRADSPEWGPHKIAAEDCVMVVRRAKADLRPGSTQRNYTVKRESDTPPVPGQQSMFS